MQAEVLMYLYVFSILNDFLNLASSFHEYTSSKDRLLLSVPSRFLRCELRRNVHLCASSPTGDHQRTVGQLF